MNDLISDMLTRMRNALAMKYTSVEVIGSKMTKEIATILTNEGYIEGFEVVKDGSGKNDDSKVDAISGATITSRAVTSAVNSCVAYSKSLKGGN